MATLTVWKFNDADTAEGVRERVLGMQAKGLINVLDAVVVEWPEGKKRPKTHQLISTAGAGAANGAFWGILFGILFFIPIFGMVFGAAMGALSGSLADYGIDDRFIDSVRSQVTEGTSALFVLSTDAVTDRIKEELGDVDVELVTTNLSVADEDALREVFEN